MFGSTPAPAAGSFQDALTHISTVHQKEIDKIRQEYDLLIKDLKKENKVLRSGLSKAGISPDDIIIDTEFHTLGAPMGSTKSNRSSNLACAAGDAVVAVASGKGSNCSPKKTPEDAMRLATPQAAGKKTEWADTKPSLQESMTQDGEFRIKEQWTKTIDAGHWNSDLYDFMVKYGQQDKQNARPGQLAAMALNPEERTGSYEEEGGFDQTTGYGCTIYPNSTFRLTWDLCGLVLISYDLIAIPLNLAFVPQPTFFSVGMDWITLLFWTADMLQGFFLGYFEKGEYVCDHKKILKHYLLTWFVPDMIVVGPEWIMSIASSSVNNENGGVSEIGKILKGARAVRALRLLRLLKLQRIINLVYDMIESEHTFIGINLAKLLVAVLVLNHVIACLWFLIGRLCMENGMVNWIQVAKIEDDSSEYKYLSSLHWSLTQFTPASMDISARNIWERAFSIVVLFFAMVAFSSIVASITGSMTSLRNMKTEDMKQFWLLRRYLRQRNVMGDLSDRIFKYLEHETQKRSKLLQRTNIKVLQHLSVALQSELTHALNSPFLVGHPFFAHLDQNMSVVMHRLCHICLKTQSHAEKEVIFAAGEKATQMYFIKGSGPGDGPEISSTPPPFGGSTVLEYTSVEGQKLYPPPQKGEWVGEAVLWTDWRHQGELFSISTNDLICVDPSSFANVMSVHPRPWFYAKRYAMKFIKFLNGLTSSRVMDILRDDVFYNAAVNDCDKIGDRPDNEEDDYFSESINISDTEVGEKGEEHEPTWRKGGTKVLKERRPLGWCPCGVGLSQCGIGPHRA